MVLQQFKMTVTGKCSHTHRNVTILLLAGICQFDRLLRYTVTFNKMEHAGLQRANGSASCRGTVSKRAVNIIVSKAALIATLTLLGLKQGQQFTTPPLSAKVVHVCSTPRHLRASPVRYTHRRTHKGTLQLSCGSLSQRLQLI